MIPLAIERRLFTAQEYEQMADAGILREDDRLELIEGEVVKMAAIGNRHSTCVRRLIRAFAGRLGEQAILDVQNPLRLDDLSEPQPDLTLLRYRADAYAATVPCAVDVLLVVEVADASLTFDRSVKVPLYARSGIAEAWVVDLTAGAVDVYREPRAGSYRVVRRCLPGEEIAPQALSDLAVSVATLLDL